MSWELLRDFSREPAQAPDRAAALAMLGSRELEIVRTIDGMRALQPEWQALYEQSTPRNPFLGPAWTLACWAAHGGRAEPFVVTLREGSRLVAVAPLCIEMRTGLRVLRFIADHRSDYLGFLCAPGMDEIEQQLLHRILESSRNWDLALLKHLNSTYSRLCECDLPGAYAAHRTKWTAAPYCASDHDWDSLHDNGPSWLKITRKRLRRFLKDGWQMERFTGREAAARLDLVASIEARSWKGREGTLRLQAGPGQDLLRQAFESPSAGAEMELWLASLDGKAIAFQIDFRISDRLWVYQQAFDDDFRRTSVGSFLAYVSFENAWRGGVREYDYLSGEEPYKLDRTNGLRPIHHVALHPRTARGWLAYGLLVAPRWRLRKVPALRAIYKKAQTLTRSIRARSGA